MPKIKAPIDIPKMERDIRREFEARVGKAMNSLTRSDLEETGAAVIDEMKKVIAKGISPINGWGRFPAYKWVGRSNALKKSASKLKGKSNAKLRKQLRSKSKSLKSGRYPYSVQGKYPGKKERPVNLFLSGKFLSAIKAVGDNGGKLSRRLYIGFYQKWAIDYESGHRTGGIKGVNDQPKRPIIPIDNESFSAIIYRKLTVKFAQIIRKRFSR